MAPAKQQLILNKDKNKIETIITTEGSPSRPGKRKNLKPLTRSYDNDGAGAGGVESDEDYFVIPEGVDQITSPVGTSTASPIRFYQYQTSQPMFAHPNLQYGLPLPVIPVPHGPALPPSLQHSVYPAYSQPVIVPTPTFTHPTPEALYLQRQQVYQQIHLKEIQQQQNQQSYGQTYGPALPPGLPQPSSSTLPVNPFTSADRYSPDLISELMKPTPVLEPSPSEASDKEDESSFEESPPTPPGVSQREITPPTPPGVSGVESPVYRVNSDLEAEEVNSDIEIVSKPVEEPKVPEDTIVISDEVDNEVDEEMLIAITAPEERKITKYIQDVMTDHFKCTFDHFRAFLDDQTILLLYDLTGQVAKIGKRRAKKWMLSNASGLLYEINKKVLSLEDADDDGSLEMSRTILYESLEKALPSFVIKGVETPYDVKRIKGLLKAATRKHQKDTLAPAETALNEQIKEFCLLLEPGEQSEVWDDEIDKLYSQLIKMKYGHVQVVVPVEHHKRVMEEYIGGLIDKDESKEQAVAWPSDCITLHKLLDQANSQCGLVGTPQPPLFKKSIKGKNKAQKKAKDWDAAEVEGSASNLLRTIPLEPNRERVKTTQVVHPMPKVAPIPHSYPPISMPQPILTPVPQPLISYRPPGPAPQYGPPVRPPPQYGPPIPPPYSLSYRPPPRPIVPGSYPDYNALGRSLNKKRRDSSAERYRHRSSKEKRRRSRSSHRRSRSRSPHGRSRSPCRNRKRSGERESRSGKRHRTPSYESDPLRHASKYKRSSRRGSEHEKKRQSEMMEKRNRIKKKGLGQQSSSNEADVLEKRKKEIEAELLTMNDSRDESVAKIKDITTAEEQTKTKLESFTEDYIQQLKVPSISRDSDTHWQRFEKVKEMRAVLDKMDQDDLLKLGSEVDLLKLESDVAGLEAGNELIEDARQEQVPVEANEPAANPEVKEPVIDPVTDHKPIVQDTAAPKDVIPKAKDPTPAADEEKGVKEEEVTQHARLMKDYGEVKVKEDKVQDKWNVVLTVQGYVFEGVALTETDAVEDASYKALLLAPYLMTKCAA